MKKLLCVLLIFGSHIALADIDPVTTPSLVTRDEKVKKVFKPDDHHWIGTIGFDSLKYEAPFNFQGETKNYKESNQDLFGLRLGIGGEINLGAGLMTATRGDIYYMGTLFTRAKTADPSIPIEYSSAKRTGQIAGIEASQSLSYLFNFKAKNPFMDYYVNLIFEPFVDIGIGMARAYNRVDYIYDATEAGGIGDTTLKHEAYRQKFEDTLLTTRIGAGFNIIDYDGYYFFMKGSINSLNVTDRKQSGFRKQTGDTPQTIEGEDNTTSFVSLQYTIGGGYKF